jgi:tripartite-type tricarboxylate transporter receptor subunit TctC
VFNVGSIASVLVVPSQSSVRNLHDALAGASVGQPLPFASCGNGTPQHMAGEMLAQAAHASLQHVPYKGCGPAITAVAATQLPVAVVTASSAAPLIAAGRVRAIAVTAPARVASLPDVPTMAEQGRFCRRAVAWLAGAGCHAGARDRPSAPGADADTGRAQRCSALREQGYTPAGESAAQFGKLIAADIERAMRP